MTENGKYSAIRCKKILLAEILTTDPFRHYRNEIFPFIQGLARKIGIRTRWNRYIIPFDPCIETRFFVRLPEEDAEHLTGTIHDFSATHVLFNESLKPEFHSVMKKFCPDVSFMCIGDRHARWEIDQFNDSVWFFEWLDENADQFCIDPEMPLIDIAVPDYEWHEGSRFSAGNRVYVKILAGHECVYRKAIKGNRFYKDVDLRNAERDFGCTFCKGGGPADISWKFSLNPLEFVRKQMVSYIKTAPRSEHKPGFMILGGAVFMHLSGFFEMISKLELPASEFLFYCRADEFLRKVRIIEKWLPFMRKTGHSLHIWVMGIENFSKDENERFNKGLDPEKILKCNEFLMKFEKEYPDNFVFSKYGGYSFILFTPWTTVSDLEENLKWARKLKIEPRGFFLRSRIQLLPLRPLTLLAMHDNLAADAFHDTLFDSGCIQTWRVSEKPWRFRNPEIALIYSIASRLPPEQADLEKDPLYISIQAWINDLPEQFHDPFIIFEFLLKQIRENPDEKRLEHILDSIKKKCIASQAEFIEKQDNAGKKESGLLKRIKESVFAKVNDGKIRGYKIDCVSEELSDRGTQTIRIDFSGVKGDVFSVFIEQGRPDGKYLFSSKDFGITYHAATPPDTEDRMFIMKTINAEIASLTLDYS
jgi:hypothetical protein